MGQNRTIEKIRHNLGLIRVNYYILICLFSIFAFFLCLMIGMAQSVWFDEAYSIELAKRPIAEIIRLTSLDVHPPLYYIILHIWGGIFGWGELALRAMSAIFMGTAVFMAGVFTKKMFGNRAALFALMFIVLSPILLRYGFEIRMYAMASFIGITATYCLTSAIYTQNAKNRNIYYAIYAVLVAVGMLTLYYLALLWLAHFVWLVWRTFKSKRSVFKSEWLFAYLASVLIFMPWMPNFISQMTNNALAPISQFMTIDNLIGIFSFNFFYRPVWQLNAVDTIAVVLLIVIIVSLTSRANKKLDGLKKDKLFLVALYMLVPIIVLSVIGIFKPMYTERYLSHIAIGGLIFIGVIVSEATRKSGWQGIVINLSLLVCIAFGLMQLVSVGNYNFQRLQKPDVENISKLVNDCSDDNVVLAADPYVATELSYYLADCEIYFYSTDLRLGGGYAPLDGSNYKLSDPKSKLSNKKTIYYFYYGDGASLVPPGLDSIERATGGGLTLEKYISDH